MNAPSLMMVVVTALLFTSFSRADEPTPDDAAIAGEPDPIPRPKLKYQGKVTRRDGLIEHQLTVTNRAEYPTALFRASPELPSIGTNKKASRFIVDIIDADTQKFVYSFVAFSSAADLDTLWFSKDGVRRVLLVLIDRKTGRTYASNVVAVEP